MLVCVLAHVVPEPYRIFFIRSLICPSGRNVVSLCAFAGVALESSFDMFFMDQAGKNVVCLCVLAGVVPEPSCQVAEAREVWSAPDDARHGHSRHSRGIRDAHRGQARPLHPTGNTLHLFNCHRVSTRSFTEYTICPWGPNR